MPPALAGKLRPRNQDGAQTAVVGVRRVRQNTMVGWSARRMGLVVNKEHRHEFFFGCPVRARLKTSLEYARWVPISTEVHWYCAVCGAEGRTRTEYMRVRAR